MAFVPKYAFLVNWIKDQILHGDLNCGDRLYSENELCSIFDVSRQTVRQAIGILEQEGVVTRRRGSGTYILWRKTHGRTGTKKIGVISTYVGEYIFMDILRAVESVLSGQGYVTQVSFTRNDPENERRALRSMLDSDVDGVIVEPTKSGLPNPNLDFYTEFRKRGIPVLFFNAKYPELDFPVVSLDDAAAGEIAASFLIGNGHRDIAGIFQCDDIQGKLRYKGYMKALSENGIAINSRRILWYATEDISELTRYPDRILRRLECCSAVCCYNDRIAVSVIDVLKQNGRSVPGDMSVVGIDNSSLADLCSPPLTSVYNPAALLGETAAKNLLAMIENPDFDAQVLFRPVMVERASVSVYTAQRTAREDEDESKHAQAVL